MIKFTKIEYDIYAPATTTELSTEKKLTLMKAISFHERNVNTI